jgi:hypothetical protein
MRETGDTIELSNDIEIVVATNSFLAIRGRTIIVAILDESCYYRDEQSANPDEELYRAILPGLSTVPGSMLIVISSPYKRSGLVYRKWREHFGKDSPNILVIQGTSRDFNHTLSQEKIDRAWKKIRPVPLQNGWLNGGTTLSLSSAARLSTLLLYRVGMSCRQYPARAILALLIRQVVARTR